MRIGTAAICSLLAVAGLVASRVEGQAGSRRHGHGQGGYVMEFRSRPSEYFGHAYVVVGRRGRSGEVRATRKAGFMPAPGADDIETLGRVRGVVGFTGEDRSTPTSERVRVRISRAAHDRVVARIDANKRRPRDFGLFDENCNTFVGRMARVARLKAPGDDLVAPSQYVREIRELNQRTASAD